MKNYLLIETNSDPPKRIRNLSNDEYNTIIKNHELIGHYKYSIRRIKEVKNNFNEFKKYHFDIKKKILEKPPDIFGILDEIFIDYNRLLINFCTSLKYTADYLERKIKKHVGQDKSEKFKNWLSSIYDSKFSYKLFYNLRNFAQHSEYPIKDFTIDRERFINTDIVRLQELRIEFDTKYLLSNEDLMKKLTELLHYGDYFPSEPLILEFEKLIELFVPKLKSLEFEILEKACKELDLITNNKTNMNFGYIENGKTKFYHIENDFIKRI